MKESDMRLDNKGKNLTDTDVSSTTREDGIRVDGTGTSGDLFAENELLGAVSAYATETAQIEHALDILVSSVNLFDVPAVDSDILS